MTTHASAPAAGARAAVRGVHHDLARVQRIRGAVRLAITVFILVVLAIVTLGWIWTSRHQPAGLSAASHVVLAIAAVAAVFALARIWRGDAPPTGSAGA